MENLSRLYLVNIIWGGGQGYHTCHIEEIMKNIGYEEYLKSKKIKNNENKVKNKREKKVVLQMKKYFKIYPKGKKTARVR